MSPTPTTIGSSDTRRPGEAGADSAASRVRARPGTRTPHLTRRSSRPAGAGLRDGPARELAFRRRRADNRVTGGGGGAERPYHQPASILLIRSVPMPSSRATARRRHTVVAGIAALFITAFLMWGYLLIKPVSSIRAHRLHDPGRPRYRQRPPPGQLLRNAAARSDLPSPSPSRTFPTMAATPSPVTTSTLSVTPATTRLPTASRTFSCSKSAASRSSPRRPLARARVPMGGRVRLPLSAAPYSSSSTCRQAMPSLSRKTSSARRGRPATSSGTRSSPPTIPRGSGPWPPHPSSRFSSGSPASVASSPFSSSSGARQCP